MPTIAARLASPTRCAAPSTIPNTTQPATPTALTPQELLRSQRRTNEEDLRRRAQNSRFLATAQAGKWAPMGNKAGVDRLDRRRSGKLVAEATKPHRDGRKSSV